MKKRIIIWGVLLAFVAGALFPAASYAKDYYIFKYPAHQIAVNYNSHGAFKLTFLSPKKFVMARDGTEFPYKEIGSGKVKMTKNRITFTYKYKSNSAKSKFSKDIPLKSGKKYYYRIKTSHEYDFEQKTLLLYKTKAAYKNKKPWKQMQVGAWQ